METHDHFGIYEELAPWIFPLATSGMAFVIGVAGWLPSLAIFRWVDAPLTFLLFMLTAWVALYDPRSRLLGIAATLVAAVGCFSSFAALLFSREHPWLG